VVLKRRPVPRHRTGSPWRRIRRMLRTPSMMARMERRTGRALANDVSRMVLPAIRSYKLDRGLLKPPSNSPVETFEHIGARIEEILPKLKKLHEADDTQVDWMGSVSALKAALGDLKKVLACYSGPDISGVLESANQLATKNVISVKETRAKAINTLFGGLENLAAKYEKLMPVLEEQGFMLEMMNKFFVLEKEMQKKGGGAGWQPVVLATAKEITQSLGEKEAVAKRASLKTSMLKAVTEIEAAARAVSPIKPEGVRPTFAEPEEPPVAPAKPVEPAKWTYMTDEGYEKDFAAYEGEKQKYEEKMKAHYEALATWAATKDKETTWAIYDADVAMHQAKSAPVRKHIHAILEKLTPRVFKCELHETPIFGS